jgi:hypothetical protein
MRILEIFKVPSERKKESSSVMHVSGRDMGFYRAENIFHKVVCFNVRLYHYRSALTLLRPDPM